MEESNSIDFPMNRFPGGLPHQLGNNSPSYLFGTHGGIRTHTVLDLNQLSPAVGLHG
jgi:hypothetical protein